MLGLQRQLNKIYAILGPWVGANISNDISTRLCWISRVQRGTLGHRRLRPLELDGDLGERQLGTWPGYAQRDGDGSSLPFGSQ